MNNTLKRSSKKPLIVVTYIITTIFLFFSFYHLVLARPRCTEQTKNQPEINTTESNKFLVDLAHEFGAKDPIQTCDNGLMAQSFDGYGPYVIRIANPDETKLKSLQCHEEPLNGGSAKQKERYIHQAYRNKDKITGRYSSCSGFASVMTAQDSSRQPLIYIVYTAR